MGESNFKTLIDAAAKTAGIDIPGLMAAIVAVESNDQPHAVRFEASWPASLLINPDKNRPWGCSVETETMLQKTSWGITQIMGANVRSLGFKGWLTELTDPALNLEYGCRFFRNLMDRWPDPADAVSAYNQGSPRKGSDGKYANQLYVDAVFKAMNPMMAIFADAPEAAPVQIAPKFRYSKKSLTILQTAHPDLQRIFLTAIEHPACPHDITIWTGHRGEAAQNEAYRSGLSQKTWPYSKHNKKPSDAVDFTPYPLVWTDIAAFTALGEHLKNVAADLGIAVTWGGDWGWDFGHLEREGK